MCILELNIWAFDNYGYILELVIWYFQNHNYKFYKPPDTQ
jgi:hypothetical protein